MKRILLRLAALALAAASISGCASAPDSFHREDFVWKTERFDVGCEEIYKRITDGGRRCIGFEYFRPAGYYLPESSTGHFDIFLPENPFLQIQSSFIGGRVELSKDAKGGTTVEVGILRKYHNSEDSMGFYRQLRGYVAGLPGCWTPD